MFVTVDDARIGVDVRGSGDAVVLLHGFPLTREVWRAQADAIAQTHRVVAIDLRGMGSSSVPDGPYLMETLAADVVAVLDALGIARASIAGHSLGGYVALAFARMFVERVARIALVCSRLMADTPEVAAAREELADRLDRENRIEPAIEAYVPRSLAPQTPATVGAAATAIAMGNTPRGAAAILRGMAQRVDSNDIAGDLTMPALVVAGRFDRGIPLDESRDVAAAFARGTLCAFERTAHLAMLEEPDRLTGVLKEWLAQPEAIGG